MTVLCTVPGEGSTAVSCSAAATLLLVSPAPAVGLARASRGAGSGHLRPPVSELYLPGLLAALLASRRFLTDVGFQRVYFLLVSSVGACSR